jgi:hypothetical protein
MGGTDGTGSPAGLRGDSNTIKDHKNRDAYHDFKKVAYSLLL